MYSLWWQPGSGLCIYRTNSTKGPPTHKHGHRSCFVADQPDTIEKSALALHAKEKHPNNFDLSIFKFMIRDSVSPRDLSRRESSVIGSLRTDVMGLNRMNIQKWMFGPLGLVTWQRFGTSWWALGPWPCLGHFDDILDRVCILVLSFICCTVRIAPLDTLSKILSAQVYVLISKFCNVVQFNSLWLWVPLLQVLLNQT